MSDDPFLDAYLPYVLRKADQTLSAPFYALLTQYSIARSEWRLLAVLHDLGELSVLDLAEAALSPQPTVTHALRRLEKRNLVTRTPGASDKRQRIVAITPSGAQLTATLIAEARRLEAEALADVNDLPLLLDRLCDLTAAVERAVITQPESIDRADDAG